VIDLHLHTTASDGRSTPEALVYEAHAAGCRTIAVTDHDTVAGLVEARAAAATLGVSFIDGIEMTAVYERRDVHVLGYFIDPASADLEAFLIAQRERRRERLVAMVDRLARAGAPLDVDAIVANLPPGKALGRPLLAHALIAAGHASDVQDAFDRYLAEGRPGYVAREGAPPADVIARIRAAGGMASFAHPGKFGRDAVIAPMVEGGLAGIEAFHPDHAPDAVVRYQDVARSFGLAVTGGSDYHGFGSGRESALGRVSLPASDFDALVARRDRSA
jgi:predicted metal-dependent phosphoesterase TrpH